MPEVRRKENEGFESLIRRFNREVQTNRVLTLAKKKLFYERPPTRRQRRETAQRKRIIKELKKKQQMGIIK